MTNPKANLTWTLCTWHGTWQQHFLFKKLIVVLKDYICFEITFVYNFNCVH